MKPSRHLLPVVLILSFFVGILTANLKCSTLCLYLGFLQENLILQYSPVSPSLMGFVLFFVTSRLFFLILIVLCKNLPFQSLTLGTLCFCYGLTAGFLFTSCLQRYGLKGIPVMAALTLPAQIFYLLSILKPVPGSKKDSLRLSSNLLLSLLFLLGVLSEYFLNPFLLQWIQDILQT